MAGIAVLPVIEGHLRTTSFCLAVTYGARDDAEGAWGTAHLLEHLVMATPGPDGVPFCERVERLGGQANAETGLETMLFYARVGAEDADETCRALLAAVAAPSLIPEHVRGEREVVLRELGAARADMADVVQDRFLARLFPDHPLGRPVGGTVAEVATIDRSAVEAGHSGGLIRANAGLMVIGPQVPDAVADAPRLTAGAPLPAVRTDPKPVDDQRPGWADEFTWMCVGGRSPGLGKPALEYEVLAHLLGGSPSSMLYRRLRHELGAAYMFQAWNRAYREAGAWRVLAGAEPEHCEDVSNAVRSCLARVAAGDVELEDLAAARRQARMQLILDMEAPLEHARLLGQRWASGLDPSPRGTMALFDEVPDEAVHQAAAYVLDSFVIAAAPEAS